MHGPPLTVMTVQSSIGSSTVHADILICPSVKCTGGLMMAALLLRGGPAVVHAGSLLV